MKKSMKIVLAIFAMSIIIVVICALVYTAYVLISKPQEVFTNEDFGISTYTSSVDKDNDGIDDQTDMLNSVREYIATNPTYKSQYYPETGYPDDNYGVCTDVVAFGMLNTGYDLRTLVNEDILANRDLYDIENVDDRIDFRRVKNLKVYFERNAISLTTDIYDIDEWQGGDIVVFEDHIGVVSDKRNSKGVALVIHHESLYQTNYEEDILEKRADIVGHYRLS